jgi:hypothetical protein
MAVSQSTSRLEAGSSFVRPRVRLSGNEWLEYAKNSSLIRTERCKVAVLWHTPVSAGIDPSGAQNYLMRAEVVEMVVEQKAF